MAEFVERQVAIDAATAVYVRTAGYKTRERVWETREAIQKLPAADVAPVVHGEWETVDWLEYDAQSCETIRCPEEGIACTRCRYVFKKDALWKRNFCPNCGARMDGGGEAG